MLPLFFNVNWGGRKIPFSIFIFLIAGMTLGGIPTL